MSHYIQLCKWTDQGIKNVKDTTRRAEDFTKMVQQMGGKVQIFYTMSEYDIISVIEAPSDEVMLQLVLSVEKLGNLRTKTIKAWTKEEASEVISKMT